MRFLITGVGGFVGPHLARELLAAGHRVFGLIRRPASARVLDALHGEFSEGFPLDAVRAADILDPRAVRSALTDVRPDGLFHLAAISFVPTSEQDPLAAYRTNFFGTLNVLTAVREALPSCRVLYVGSGDAYGAAGNDVPVLTEDVPLRPVSPYGVSKAAADLAAFQAGWVGASVVRARPFTHTGPGQRPEFVCSNFARQIARIEEGKQPPVLEVGNLDAERDFCDVRDIVAGYRALWERGDAGEVYNLCSGKGIPIRAIVSELCHRARRPIEVRIAEARRRPNEVHRLVGSYEKAEARTGWRPIRDVGQTIDDLLAYWRRREAERA